MLEMSVGPVVWDAFHWPVNGIVLAGFLALIAIIFLLRKKVYGFQFIGTYKAAIPALAYAVVLTIIMGLTRQSVDGVWLNNMLSFWPFVLIYVYIALILGQIILRRITGKMQYPSEDNLSENHGDIHIDQHEGPERQHVVQPCTILILSRQSHDDGLHDGIDQCRYRCLIGADELKTIHPLP